MSKPVWLGKDVFGGVPSHRRPDRKPPPHWRLDAVFATNRPHDLALSPDGTRAALIIDVEGTSDVWVIDLAKRDLTRLTTDRGPVAFWEDAAPLWSPDGSQIAYNADGHVCIVASRGGPPRRLVQGSIGCWIDERSMVVVVERDRCSRLARVDLDDPWPIPIGPRDGDVGRVRITGDNRFLASFWPKDDKSRSDIVLVDPDGSWETLVGHPDRRAGNHAVSGDRVAYTLEDGEWAAVFLTDLKGGEHTRLAAGEWDFSELAWASDGDGLLGLCTARGRTSLARIGLDGDVEVVAEGGTWGPPAPTRYGVVALHEAHNSPPSVVVLEVDSRRTIYEGAPAAVRSAPYANLEAVSFWSGDLDVQGFLFRPSDTSTPVPAVVYPHGGPTTHYGDEWDGHAQYFVDKGYAWFAVNFRGSTSYGLSFERANHGDWGVGDVDDCIAAGRYLAGLDWVDASRIAIFGASYGAYLALASLVRPDHPFACGVSKYGDCDMLTSWAQADRDGIEDLERMMGHPSRNRERYRAGSPIHQVDRLKRPILIAHGEQDARVHPRQSEELVEALDEMGATYEYMTYPTEGHGLLRREPQLHFHRRLERFLDWYLM